MRHYHIHTRVTQAADGCRSGQDWGSMCAALLSGQLGSVRTQPLESNTPGAGPWSARG